MKKSLRMSGLGLICTLFLVMLFSGQALAIPQAMPVSPGDSSGIAVTEQVCPTFSWSLAAEAVSYRVEVYEQATADLLPYEAMSTVAGPLISKDIAAPALTWTPSAHECLDRGMKYAWYVLGIDNNGEGEWSYGKVFEIESSALTFEQKDAVEEVVKEYLEKEAAKAAALTAARPERAATVTISRPSETAAQRSEGAGIEAQSIQPQSLTSVGVQILDNLNVSGNLQLPATTATTGVIMQNGNTLLHTYGMGNFFAGGATGNLTMTGSFNTGIGGSALLANTTGNYNTASGAYALNSNTTGYSNTASGYDALRSNTTGYSNTASGVSALYNNTTASKNTALGTNSLYKQSYYAGTPWDSLNTAVGFDALYSNQPTSVDNGVANTAIGAFALRANTTGNWNTATGLNALLNNNSGYGNTANGQRALLNNTTGHSNTATGLGALNNNTTGYANTAIGNGADVLGVDLTNATAIGNGALVDASNKVRIGNSSVTVIEGKVGWSTPSDIRKKKDVEDIGFGLAFIKSLRPVQYRLIQGNDRIDFGFIAQEVEARIGTDYNVLGIAEDADRSLSLRYTDFIAPMVKAMQEQQAQIEMQQAQGVQQQETIEAQKTRIEMLETRLARLEALLGAGK